MENLVIVSKQIAKIDWNKEKALKEAQDIMAKYDGLEFSEEQLPEAKKELATLRKVSKEINAQALAIDKELTAPVKLFRDEVKEVKAIVDNGISFIDDQVKEFENKQKEERKQEILSMESYVEVQDYIKFDDNWLLKKWTNESLDLTFNEIAETIKSQINTIKTMATSHNLSSDKYVERLKTSTLDDVLQRIVEAAEVVAEIKEEEKPVIVDIPKDEKLVSVTRTLKGTVSSLKLLKGYAEQLGIEWLK